MASVSYKAMRGATIARTRITIWRFERFRSEGKLLTKSTRSHYRRWT